MMFADFREDDKDGNDTITAPKLVCRYTLSQVPEP